MCRSCWGGGRLHAWQMLTNMRYAYLPVGVQPARASVSRTTSAVMGPWWALWSLLGVRGFRGVWDSLFLPGLLLTLWSRRNRPGLSSGTSPPRIIARRHMGSFYPLAAWGNWCDVLRPPYAIRCCAHVEWLALLTPEGGWFRQGAPVASHLPAHTWDSSTPARMCGAIGATFCILTGASGSARYDGWGGTPAALSSARFGSARSTPMRQHLGSSFPLACWVQCRLAVLLRFVLVANMDVFYKAQRSQTRLLIPTFASTATADAVGSIYDLPRQPAQLYIGCKALASFCHWGSYAPMAL